MILEVLTEEISNFISYSEERGLYPNLLKDEKAMDLLRFLMLRSSEYLELQNLSKLNPYQKQI